jgi:NAD-dependent deacetylase
MLDTVKAWVRHSQRIAVLTGAGVSAESGVPTFRDVQTGYWAQFRPEDMATEAGFRAHPQRVWDWYQHRRDLLAGVSPNAGHRALADFQHRYPGRFTLITQNVDGLHRRAGSHQVLELHGNLFRAKCLDEDRPVESWLDSEEIPPRCPRCGGLCQRGSCARRNRPPRPPRFSSASAPRPWSTPPPTCRSPRSGPGRRWWKSTPNQPRSVPRSPSA